MLSCEEKGDTHSVAPEGVTQTDVWKHIGLEVLEQCKKIPNFHFLFHTRPY